MGILPLAPCAGGCPANSMAHTKTAWDRAVPAAATEGALVVVEQRADALVKLRPTLQPALGEAWAKHRVLDRPVPLVGAVKRAKERFIVGKQFSQRVQKQTRAEAPRTRENVVRPGFDLPQRVRRFIEVSVVAFAPFGEGLGADGEVAARAA